MLRIENIAKSYGAQVLFEDLNYAFPANERIALVGANGVGKTTLLNILCNLEEADAGKVLIPQNTVIGYLPQNPNGNPAQTILGECEAGATNIVALKLKMDAAAKKTGMDAANQFEESETAFRLAGGYSLSAKATRILVGLGFQNDALENHPATLSGGWRMRLELARLFIKDPDVLILDEPTNHLDLPSLVWVEKWLQEYRGTLLYVSHDRALLNRLSTVTLHLANQELNPYPGNFDHFLEIKDMRQDLARKTAKSLESKRQHMEKFVERFGAKATKATQAQSRVKMINKIRSLESQIKIDQGESTMGVPIPPPEKTPRIVLDIQAGTIGYDKPLARSIKLQMERGSKVAIIGSNGIGKSTFLKTVCGLISPLEGSFKATEGVTLTYFAQDQLDSISLEDSVLSNLTQATGMSDREARNLLGAFLFGGDDVKKPASVLSGGELSRLGLARSVGKKCGLMLLDEPTNHLDMSSVEILADSLSHYTGNIVFVSHDRTFIDQVCTHIFAMLPDGRSMLFEGNLEDYARQAELCGFPNVLSTEQEETRPQSSAPNDHAYARSKEQKRQKEKAQRALQACEAEQEKIRSSIASIEGELENTAPTDHTRLAELGKKLVIVRQNLGEQEELWLKLAEELDS